MGGFRVFSGGTNPSGHVGGRLGCHFTSVRIAPARSASVRFALVTITSAMLAPIGFHALEVLLTELSATRGGG